MSSGFPFPPPGKWIGTCFSQISATSQFSSFLFSFFFQFFFFCFVLRNRKGCTPKCHHSTFPWTNSLVFFSIVWNIINTDLQVRTVLHCCRQLIMVMTCVCAETCQRLPDCETLLWSEGVWYCQKVRIQGVQLQYCDDGKMSVVCNYIEMYMFFCGIHNKK